MKREKRMRDGRDGPEDCKDEAQCSQPMQCSREPLALVIRNKARHLRDKAHSLEKLADEFERRYISPESEGILMSAILNLRD